MTAFTRRNMLSVAAATAATAVSSVTLPEPAAADAAEDMQLFVTLSAAITGIDPTTLAPAVDPVQIKRQYFAQASADPAFPQLLKITKDAPPRRLRRAGDE